MGNSRTFAVLAITVLGSIIPFACSQPSAPSDALSTGPTADIGSSAPIDSEILLAIVALDYPAGSAPNMWQYRDLWSQITDRWGELQNEDDFRTAFFTVYESKQLYPDMTALYVLQCLAASQPYNPDVLQESKSIHASLQESFHNTMAEAEAMQAEEQAALQAQLDANQEAARERGAARNYAKVEAKERAAQAEEAARQRGFAWSKQQKAMQEQKFGIRSPQAPPVARARQYGGSYQTPRQTLMAPRSSTAGGTVYVAPNSGKRYHASSSCRGLNNANSVTSMGLGAATSAGYTACQICY